MASKRVGVFLTGWTVLYCISASADVLEQEKFPDTASKNNTEKSVDDTPQIYELLLETNVSNRYARTLITSKVKNVNNKAQENKFSFVVPDQAFISSFIMEIDGKKYEAYVKEKEEAKKTYDEAVASGIGAAHVAVTARDSNRFTVSLNIEPQSKATFYLRYEELLIRKNEKYELVLNINPGQPVKKLAVAVNIAESRPLKFVKVPSLRSGNEIKKNDNNADPEAEVQHVNDTSTIVTFKPDVVKQKLLSTILGGKEYKGLSGQFIVQYDVVRDPHGGEILVDGGYFVHFFAPEDLTPLKKQIVFVLDTSGSMLGKKIEQLKEAMYSILEELKPEDTFSIIDFNSEINAWDIEQLKISYQISPIYESNQKNLTVLPNSFPVTADNIKKAKQVIEKFKADGGTDIEGGLTVALSIINRFYTSRGNQPLIIFLTDGEAIRGTTEEIIATTSKLNELKVPIISLSFGAEADKLFLQQLALKNYGFSRHIYEAADASLQLRNFYHEISSPLLTNVTFKYVDKVKNVTKTHFPIFFRGTEICTAGIAEAGFESTIVEGLSSRGLIDLQSKVYQSAGSLERLWAYLTVKQLLEQRQVVKDNESITGEALALALNYSFVTDITSLVVVKPNETTALDLEDASTSSNNIGGLNRHASSSLMSAMPRTTFAADVMPYFEPIWIKNILSNNESLLINGKNFTLGLDKVFGDGNECSNSIDNSTGHCRLLHECPQFHKNLTDIEVYKKYFCEQKSYAGICCPASL